VLVGKSFLLFVGAGSGGAFWGGEVGGGGGGWACAQVRAKQAGDTRFKKRGEQVVALISQQKI